MRLETGNSRHMTISQFKGTIFRLFELTRSPGDEAEVLECNLLSQDGEGVSCVQLRAGTSLAADLVAAGHADWDTCSISSLDTSASAGDEEVEAPNGVDTDILDMEKLKEVTHRGLQDYLEDNIAAVDESASIPTLCTGVEGQSVQSKFELETVSSKDPKPISPMSIPSLAVLENSQFHMKTPNILWSQTDQHLTLNVKFYSALELSPEQASRFSCVLCNKLFAVLDPLEDRKEECEGGGY